MELLLPAAFFLLGAIIASFAGCVAARLHSGASIAFARSCCDACGAILPAFSLVPILSWIFLGGRCHACGARITALALVSEAALGLIYALAYLALGLTPALALFLASAGLLLALVLYDFAHTVLPDELLYPFLGSAILFALLSGAPLIIYAIALLIGLALALIHVLSGGRAMGLADAPLAVGLALLAGVHAFAGFVFSFWVGALFGIGLLARAPKGHRMGIEVPFAPFLAIGFLLAYFTGWDPFAPLLAVFTSPL